jgi:hypothetical protein
MGYDRDKAIDYARRYWDRPCDDGVFWLTNEAVNVEQKRKELKAPAKGGWEALFAPDGMGGEKAVFRRTAFDGTLEEILIQGWAGLADCAHFLSRSLQSGGINISELGVGSLVMNLKARADTKTLAEKVSQERGQRIVDTGIFKKGDMIGYFNISPAGDYGGALAYSHSTMYVRKLSPADPGRITCHTKSRFAGLSSYADEWYLNSGHYKYTLIHFASDDPKPTPALVALLTGWWKIQYGGRTEYYYILKDGRARYTLRPPKSKNEQLNIGEGSAYWFSESSKITFIWKNTGTVEVWTQNKPGNAFNIKVNDTPGTAARLF